MNRSEARAGLVSFLQTIVKPGSDVTRAASDANLFDAGFLDSLAIIQIVMHLEQAHGVNLASQGIDPTQLGTIDGILDAIAAA